MLLKLFTFSLTSFLVLYVLRGLGIFGFLPGGFIVVCLLVALISGLGWGIQKTRRF